MHYAGLFRLATLTLCLAMLFGCSKGAGTGKQEQKQTGEVIAEVNGVAITSGDFDKELELLPPYLKQMADTPDGKKEMLDSMIVRELVLQDARKQGIDKSQEVADRLEDMKKRVIVEAYLKKKVEEGAQIADADLQKFYDQNKDKFKTGAQVRASHILVKTEKEAQDILAQLKGGAKFEDLAMKHSIDPAGKKGGDLGWFGKGTMIPEFEQVAFAMKEGDVSGAVKTKFGYHVIKLTGKRPAGSLPFAEVKEQIKANLLPQKQQEVFQKVKEDLKKVAKISIKEGALQGAAKAPQPQTPAGEAEKK